MVLLLLVYLFLWLPLNITEGSGKQAEEIYNVVFQGQPYHYEVVA